jgi:hypothetical protein
MPIEAVYTSLTTAIDIASKLRDASKRVNDAEIRSILADLSLALSDVKMQLAESRNEAAELKEQLASKEQEIRGLKTQLAEERAVESNTNDWEKSPHYEQMKRVIICLAQIDPQHLEADEIISRTGLNRVHGNLILSDLVDQNMLNVHHQFMEPCTFNLTQLARRYVVDNQLT